MDPEANAAVFTPPLRVLHTSDVHIGWVKGHGDDHLDTCLCPLHGIVDAVRDHRADALLVAGDLFDHGRVSNAVVAATLDLLASTEVPVVLLPGNHDVHDGQSLWTRCAAEVAASGAHLLDDPDGSHLTLFDGALTVWGKAMEEHEPGYRPLADVPARSGDGWWIVAGHGHHEPGGLSTMRSSPLSPDEIAQTCADYVALGHFHVRTDVSSGGVPAWYPGAPTGSVSSGTANLVAFGEGVAVEHVEVIEPEAGCAM